MPNSRRWGCSMSTGERYRLVCNECSERWWAGALDALAIRCPQCNGYDTDLDDHPCALLALRNMAEPAPVS